MELLLGSLTGLLVQTPMVGIAFLALAPFLATALAGGASAAASIYGAKKMTSAAQASAKAQNEGLDKQIALEREMEARRQEEWERSEARNQQNWQDEVTREQRNLDREQGNVDRNFGEAVFRDRRLDPYRVAGRAALADLDQRRQGSMADLLPTGRI